MKKVTKWDKNHMKHKGVTYYTREVQQDRALYIAKIF